MAIWAQFRYAQSIGFGGEVFYFFFVTGCLTSTYFVSNYEIKKCELSNTGKSFMWIIRHVSTGPQ